MMRSAWFGVPSACEFSCHRNWGACVGLRCCCDFGGVLAWLARGLVGKSCVLGRFAVV